MQKKIIAIFIIALLSILFFLYEKDQPKKVVYKQEKTSQITNLKKIKDNHIKALKQQSGFSLCEQELKEFNLDLNETSFIYQIKSNNDTLKDISCKKIYEVEKRRLPAEVYNEYLEDSVKTEDEILIDQGYYPKSEWYIPPTEIEIDYVDYHNKTISFIEYKESDKNMDFLLKEENLVLSSNNRDVIFKDNIYINTQKVKDIVAYIFKDDINKISLDKRIYIKDDDIFSNFEINVDNKTRLFKVTSIYFYNNSFNQQGFIINGKLSSNQDYSMMIHGNLNSNRLSGTFNFLKRNDTYHFRTIDNYGLIFKFEPDDRKFKQLVLNKDGSFKIIHIYGNKIIHFEESNLEEHYLEILLNPNWGDYYKFYEQQSVSLIKNFSLINQSNSENNILKIDTGDINNSITFIFPKTISIQNFIDKIKIKNELEEIITFDKNQISNLIIQ